MLRVLTESGRHLSCESAPVLVQGAAFGVGVVYRWAVDHAGDVFSAVGEDERKRVLVVLKHLGLVVALGDDPPSGAQEFGHRLGYGRPFGGALMKIGAGSLA